MTQDTPKSRLAQSYGEAIHDLLKKYSSGKADGVGARLATYAQKHPVRTTLLAGTSVIAIAASVGAWGLAVTAAQALGVAGFVLAREAATFKEHRHIMAISSLSCVFSAAQQGVMAALADNPGSYIPGSVMLGHAAVTLGAFSVIPEANKALRNAVTWAGGAVGALAAGYAAQKYGADSGFIPAATTAVNAVVFSIKDGRTPRARQAYLGLNFAHFVYFATQPEPSMALVASEAMYFATHCNTLAQHDVPVADRATGRPFTKKERLSSYFKEIIVKGKKAADIGQTRAEQGWKRLDTRVYEKVGKLVFGT